MADPLPNLKVEFPNAEIVGDPPPSGEGGTEPTPPAVSTDPQPSLFPDSAPVESRPPPSDFDFAFGKGPAPEVEAPPSVEQSDDFKYAFEHEPTASEAAGAIGRQANYGIVETGTPIAGMLMGAQIGALGGPAAAVTIPLGALAGYFAGYFGGKQINSWLEKYGLSKPFEKEDKKLKPYAVFGLILGTGLPFAAGPNIMAKLGFRYAESKVGGFLNRIIETAKANPRAFFAAEVASVQGSATLGGVAENYAPGSLWARLPSEILGGVIGGMIPRMILHGAPLLIQGTNSMLLRWKDSTQRSQAGMIIRKIFKNAGENWEDVVKQLEEVDMTLIDGAGDAVIRTPAQRVDSRGLLQLETLMRQRFKDFGAEAADKAEKSLQAIEKLMTLLMHTGDPAAFTKVAQMRYQNYKDLIENLIQTAIEKSIKAADKLKSGTGESLSALSKGAKEHVTAALIQARKVERELWNKVIQTGEADPGRTLAAYAKNKVGKLRSDPLDPTIELEIKRLQGIIAKREETGVFEEGEILARDLVNLRSKLLHFAREETDENLQRIYGDIAEAVKLDMKDAMKKLPFYPEAAAFSAALHDTFTRTFVGTVRRKATQGQMPVPPEVMLRKALTGSNEAVALKMKELENAVNFLPDIAKKGTKFTPDELAEATESVDAFTDLSERFLRTLADELVDDNNQITPSRANKFLNDYKELLDGFPGLRAEMEVAGKSTADAKKVVQAINGLDSSIVGKTAFAKVAGYDSASDAINSALRGNTPISDLKQMAQMAKDGGEASAEGFRAAIWDYVIALNKRDPGQSSDIARIAEDFFGGLRPGEPSLVDIMVSHGVMSPEQVKNMKSLFKEAAKVVKSQAGDATLEGGLVQGANGLESLMLAMYGARMGALLGQGTPGSSLQLAGRGVGFVQRQMDKIPSAKVEKLLREAAENPRVFALLARTPKTDKEAFYIGRSLHAYLFANGYLAVDDVFDEGEE